MISEYIKPLKIGNVQLKNNIIAAPIAGFSDFAYRKICRDFGAGLTVTELTSAKGLFYQSKGTTELLYSIEQHGDQIFAGLNKTLGIDLKSVLLGYFRQKLVSDKK